MSAPVEPGSLTPAKLRELIALRARGSSGKWQIDRGLLGGSFRYLAITTWRRKQHDNKNGNIASVPTSRIETIEQPYSGETITRRHKIDTADDDALLIVEAVNWLKPMAEALLRGDQLDETAWLIEWPADKYNVLRYYAAGEQAVMSANDATRFSRKQDAEAIARAEKLRGHKIVEHAWVNIDRREAKP